MTKFQRIKKWDRDGPRACGHPFRTPSAVFGGGFLSTVIFRFPFRFCRLFVFLCRTFLLLLLLWLFLYVSDSEESGTREGARPSRSHSCLWVLFFARGRSFSGIRFVFRMLINSIAYKFWSRTFATSTHRHTHTCIYDTHTLYIPLMRWVCSPRSVVHFSFFLLFVFVVTVRSAFLLTIVNQSHFSISLRLFRTHIDGVFTYVFMYCVCTRHMYVCMGVCGM